MVVGISTRETKAGRWRVQDQPVLKTGQWDGSVGKGAYSQGWGLSLIPETHTLGKNQFPQVVSNPLNIHTCKHTQLPVKSMFFTHLKYVHYLLFHINKKKIHLLNLKKKIHNSYCDRGQMFITLNAPTSPFIYATTKQILWDTITRNSSYNRFMSLTVVHRILFYHSSYFLS